MAPLSMLILNNELVDINTTFADVWDENIIVVDIKIHHPAGAVGEYLQRLVTEHKHIALDLLAWRWQQHN